jgi:hypothetical protein
MLLDFYARRLRGLYAEPGSLVKQDPVGRYDPQRMMSSTKSVSSDMRNKAFIGKRGLKSSILRSEHLLFLLLPQDDDQKMPQCHSD